MSKYVGPKCKLCRAEGQKLMLKGSRCLSAKCAFDKRDYPPGQHGLRQRRGRKKSDYGIRLREKQKARKIYGLREKQFRNLYFKAARMRGVTGENLLQLLERRLDNVVYRMGFAMTRSEARQLVRHGHFLVNGKKANIPSLLVNPSVTVEVKENSRKLVPIVNAIDISEASGLPPWVERDKEQMRAVITRLPTIDEAGVPVDMQMIVELYSR